MINYCLFTFSVCPAKMDLCIVLDASGSIRQSNPVNGSYDNWDLLLDFVNLLVDRLVISPEEAHVGVLQFSYFSYKLIGLLQYREKTQLQRAISGLRYIGGFTHTSAAIDKMRTECFNTRGDRPDIPNIAIIFTDGISTIDPELTVPAAERAKQSGISIFAVGVTSVQAEAALKNISSMPQRQGQNWFASTSYLLLNLLVDEVSGHTCDTAIEAIPPGQCTFLVLKPTI